METIVIEHFNGILIHKSGPAKKQHTNHLLYIKYFRVCGHELLLIIIIIIIITIRRRMTNSMAYEILKFNAAFTRAL